MQNILEETKYIFVCVSCRDHFVPSQWEKTLHCNVISHWLGAYTKWSLILSFLDIDTSGMGEIQPEGRPGGWIKIKMPSYQYRKSHCGDKKILRPSYLHNGISYTGKTTSLYWIGVQNISISHVMVSIISCGCWWPSKVRSQGISSLGVDLVLSWNIPTPESLKFEQIIS